MPDSWRGEEGACRIDQDGAEGEGRDWARGGHHAIIPSRCRSITPSCHHDGIIKQRIDIARMCRHFRNLSHKVLCYNITFGGTPINA